MKKKQPFRQHTNVYDMGKDSAIGAFLWWLAVVAIGLIYFWATGQFKDW